MTLCRTTFQKTLRRIVLPLCLVISSSIEAASPCQDEFGKSCQAFVQDFEHPLHETFSDCYDGKNPDAIEGLIESGASVNVAPDRYDGRSPLHRATRACGEFMKPIARELLEHGASVDARDDWGSTPLHYAAYNNPDTARLLLEKGASASASRNNGETVLHSLASGMESAAHVELIGVLLENGADATAVDADGNTVLHAAVTGYGNQHQIAGLRELHAAGTPVNQRNDRGLTPAHRAAIYGNAGGRLRTLLRAGANPNLRAEQQGDGIHDTVSPGDTPLHVVAKESTLSDCTVSGGELLIEHGADPNRRDAKGFTPLHMVANAEEWTDDRSASCVAKWMDLLISAGVNVNALSNQDETPLAIAQQRHNPYGVQALEAADARVTVASDADPAESIRPGKSFEDYRNIVQNASGARKAAAATEAARLLIRQWSISQDADSLAEAGADWWNRSREMRQIQRYLSVATAEGDPESSTAVFEWQSKLISELDASGRLVGAEALRGVVETFGKYVGYAEICGAEQQARKDYGSFASAVLQRYELEKTSIDNYGRHSVEVYEDLRSYFQPTFRSAYSTFRNSDLECNKEALALAEETAKKAVRRWDPS